MAMIMGLPSIIGHGTLSKQPTQYRQASSQLDWVESALARMQLCRGNCKAAASGPLMKWHGMTVTTSSLPPEYRSVDQYIWKPFLIDDFCPKYRDK